MKRNKNRNKIRKFLHCMSDIDCRIEEIKKKIEYVDNIKKESSIKDDLLSTMNDDLIELIKKKYIVDHIISLNLNDTEKSIYHLRFIDGFQFKYISKRLHLNITTVMLYENNIISKIESQWI